MIKTKQYHRAKKFLGQEWNNMNLQWKLMISFTFTVIIILFVNIFMYLNINSVMARVDEVYVSNVSLNGLTDALEKVQTSMTEYLDTKSSDALDSYYRSEQDYRDLLEKLNTKVTDNDILLTEKNIASLSENYLTMTQEIVQAKRGRNVEKYRTYYEEASILYSDINNFIYSLNNEQFKSNSNTYAVLLASLRYLEIVSTIILVVVGVSNVGLISLLTRNITKPLNELAKAANEVAEGNFDVTLDTSEAVDEIGIVSKAFIKMISSIQLYIEQIKSNIERESKMKERELIMEGHLKDAQLMSLQAQINPHFLFNTLNAGAQLAMLEGADKTCVFIENMAEFFRYNIKKINQDATILEEIKLVDNYIYILNVRFSGEIQYKKNIDENLLETKVPSMILQPIVENAINYGIRNIGREGIIELSLYEEKKHICISIWDNGMGMEPEKIEQILTGKLKEVDLSSNSNGIGLGNVIERLKLFFDTDEVMKIISEGKNMGSEFIITIPMEEEGSE